MARIPEVQTRPATQPPLEAATAVPASDLRRRLQPRTFTSLRHRDYRLLWMGILCTSAATWMQQVALGWLMYDMTNSPFLLGALMACSAVPFLGLAPVGGVVADRMDRKMLMMASQFGCLAMYIALVALLFFDVLQPWHLFVFTLLEGVCWSFNQPARQSIIPQIVPREDLMNAVALQSVGFNVTRVLGPAIGGVLMASVGGLGTFVLVTFFWVGLIAITIPINVPPHPPSKGRRLSVWGDFMLGIGYIRTNPVVFSLIVVGLVPQVIALPYINLLPVFARDVFSMDARGLGELNAAAGVGAVISTLIIASWGSSFRGKGKLILGAGFALGLMIVLFSQSTSYGLALPVLSLVGLFTMAFLALSNTSVQVFTPQQYLGRVMGVYMINRGLMPIGAFVSGMIAEAAGAPFALTVMGSLTMAFIVLGAILMPHLRRLE